MSSGHASNPTAASTATQRHLGTRQTPKLTESQTLRLSFTVTSTAPLPQNHPPFLRFFVAAGKSWQTPHHRHFATTSGVASIRWPSSKTLLSTFREVQLKQLKQATNQERSHAGRPWNHQGRRARKKTWEKYPSFAEGTPCSSFYLHGPSPVWESILRQAPGFCHLRERVAVRLHPGPRLLHCVSGRPLLIGFKVDLDHFGRGKLISSTYPPSISLPRGFKKCRPF